MNNGFLIFFSLFDFMYHSNRLTMHFCVFSNGDMDRSLIGFDWTPDWTKKGKRILEVDLFYFTFDLTKYIR